MKNLPIAEINQLISRTDLLIKRAAVMLHNGKKGEQFPPGSEFSETELKSYEADLSTLIASLLNTPNVPAIVWISPISFAYQSVPDSNQWTWLERFHTSLIASKDFLQSFIKNNGE